MDVSQFLAAVDQAESAGTLTSFHAACIRSSLQDDRMQAVDWQKIIDLIVKLLPILLPLLVQLFQPKPTSPSQPSTTPVLDKIRDTISVK